MIQLGRGRSCQRKVGQVVTIVTFHYAKQTVVLRIGILRWTRSGQNFSNWVRLMDFRSKFEHFRSGIESS